MVMVMMVHVCTSVPVSTRVPGSAGTRVCTRVPVPVLQSGGDVGSMLLECVHVYGHVCTGILQSGGMSHIAILKSIPRLSDTTHYDCSPHARLRRWRGGTLRIDNACAGSISHHPQVATRLSVLVRLDVPVPVPLCTRNKRSGDSGRELDAGVFIVGPDLQDSPCLLSRCGVGLHPYITNWFVY